MSQPQGTPISTHELQRKTDLAIPLNSKHTPPGARISLGLHGEHRSLAALRRHVWPGMRGCALSAHDRRLEQGSRCCGVSTCRHLWKHAEKMRRMFLRKRTISCLHGRNYLLACILIVYGGDCGCELFVFPITVYIYYFTSIT